VIRPNNETQHERFIQVLSLLKKTGFRRITFA
jgi:biopolymer transport protein ExbD